MRFHQEYDEFLDQYEENYEINQEDDFYSDDNEDLENEDSHNGQIISPETKAGENKSVCQIKRSYQRLKSNQSVISTAK